MPKILLIVAILVSLGTAGISYFDRQAAKETAAELDSVQATLTSTKGELAASQKEVADQKEAADALTAAKDAAEKEVATARAESQKAAAALAEAQASVTQIQGQIAALNDQVAEKDKTIAELSTATASAPTETAVVDETRLSELEAMNASLTAKLSEAESALGGLRKKEQDRAALKMREGLEGRVLAVNPAWNFVVLSIGDKQGVVNNAELLLKRGTQYLGKVRITSVEPSTSIADIVANSLPAGVSVQPGDSVIFASQSATN